MLKDKEKSHTDTLHPGPFQLNTCPLRSTAVKAGQLTLTRRRRRLNLTAQGGELLEELPRIGQGGGAVDYAPLYIGRLLLFNKIHQVLVLDVVTAADHKNDGILERSSVLWQYIPTF